MVHSFALVMAECHNKYYSSTVCDRIDVAATINFSTQFGVATIREQHLIKSGIYFVQRGHGLK